MSKLDVLRSHWLNRMTAVIREIFDEVEATLNDYREEADRNRNENAELKRQLRDVLFRTEEDLNEEAHHVSQHVPDEVFPAESPGSGSGNQKETEEPLQAEDHVQSPDLFSDKKPCLQDLKDSISKTGSVNTESIQSLSILPYTDEQHLGVQQMHTDETCNAIKNEQEDTIITITSSVITTPAGQCHDSNTTHRLRNDCNNSTTQRKELHCTQYSTSRTVSSKVDHNNGDGPYKCNKCGRQLKDLAKLHMHRRLHERSFTCHWCGRNFSKFDYLRMHMRTHTGERPYRCNWCSKTFTQCGNMRRHERTCQKLTKESTAYSKDNTPLLKL